MNKERFRYFVNEDAHRVLLGAVRMEPEKVRSIVAHDRNILWATTSFGENVLHYLAIENDIEGVKLLRSVGSPISSWALTHALQHGHTEMVVLLLELGAEPELTSCSRALDSKTWNLDKKTKRLMRSYFSQYGYQI